MGCCKGRPLSLLITLALVASLSGWRAEAAHARLSFRLSPTPEQIRPVPQNFLGLALEYRSIPWIVGPAGQPANPVLVQLLRNLDPDGHPVLRIGGQSGDRTWWPVPGVSQPPGVTYALSPSWAARARSLAEAADARYILGLGFLADIPRLEQIEAEQLVRGVGRAHVAALEIGNEPELYTVVPFYRMLHGTPVPWYVRQGTPVFGRGPDWSPSTFVPDFARNLAPLPRLPIAGPSTGNLGLLESFAGAFLSPTSRVRMVTWHAYGLNGCLRTSANPWSPSVPHLLSTLASRGWSAGIDRYVALAHQDGASFWLDEVGSVSCNGRPGVSDTAAAALWALDTLFTAASAEVDGVDLHSYPGLVNNLFDFSRAHGQWTAVVHPLYYGALMFEQAAPAGARLVAVSSPSPGQVRAWATRTPDGAEHVVFINAGLRFPAHIVLSVPGARAPAQLERLRAPSPGATWGITLGGVAFPAATETGLLPSPGSTPVPNRSGRFSVTVPPGSAAMLTLTGTSTSSTGS